MIFNIMHATHLILNQDISLGRNFYKTSCTGFHIDHRTDDEPIKLLSSSLNYRNVIFVMLYLTWMLDPRLRGDALMSKLLIIKLEGDLTSNTLNIIICNTRIR